MMGSAEYLWRLNRDYVNRLARARSYLDLLEQLMVTGGANDNDVFMTLQTMRTHLDDLSDEHRLWCYTDYYESPETKRVVQSLQAVRRALTSFDQMRERHSADFGDLALVLDRLPRPTPTITHVPSGDLWDLTLTALDDLADYRHDMNAANLA